ncbi:MAG: hypothetical protein M1833_002044 [Piccolia ochrophora]|nr:MAG: hypothetical protein M1833_002044 [Piccolia ochrophora]
MAPRVLLLGGHGKIALLLTPRLLARSWNVTSVVRDAAHTEAIERLAAGQPGEINVLVRSLDDVDSPQVAQSVLDETKPDYVVFAAGAGGKGGASRTYAVDRDAATHFIRAAVATPSVTKFLLVSYLGSRRARAAWWSDDDWASVQRTNTQVLPDYYQAKIVADECLTALAGRRVKEGDKGFQAVVLRPGTLTDDEGTGKVKLGKTGSAKVTRADVAEVIERILVRDDVKGWVDLVQGSSDIGEELERIVREGEDSVEGEDVGEMEKKYL